MGTVKQLRQADLLARITTAPKSKPDIIYGLVAGTAQHDLDEFEEAGLIEVDRANKPNLISLAQTFTNFSDLVNPND